MKKKNVLFIIPNNYYPEDIRVYNESNTLSETTDYRCFVLTPRKKGEKYFEIINNIKCYRFPYYDASSIIGLFSEYFIVTFFLFFLSPYVVFRNKIKVIHLANPPDHLILLVYWLKLFNRKIIFDHHDLSLEVIKGKFKSKKSVIVQILVWGSSIFEWLSIKLADKVITSNNSIKEYDQRIEKKKKIIVVRNSSNVQYLSIKEIPKKRRDYLHLGYFGVIGGDRAAGIENFVAIAKELLARNIKFQFTVIGDGAGLKPLKSLAEKNGLKDYFSFLGYVPLQQAFGLIINFDFGILPWPDIPKNHLLSAIKVMNYMCCGVPVCTLNLKEQLLSTSGIGIHTDTFEEMVDKIIKIKNNKNSYNALRTRTLNYFNTVLCWEKQEFFLLEAYKSLESKQKDKNIAMIGYTSISTDSRVIRESIAAKKAGYNVDLYTLKEDKDYCLEEINIYRSKAKQYKGDKKIYFIVSYLSFFLYCFWRLTLRGRKYSVIHVNNMPNFLVFCCIFPKIFGVKIILDVHDFMPEVFAEKFNITLDHWLIRLLYYEERISINFANEIIAINCLQIERFKKNKIKKKKFVEILNAADETIYTPFCNHDFLKDKINIIFPSTIAQRLGVDILIDAMHIIVNEKKYANIEMKIFGDGEYSNNVKRSIEIKNLSSNVNFYNKFIDFKELSVEMENAHIGVVPLPEGYSNSLALPIKLHEYFIKGLAVIVSDLPALRKYCPDCVIFFRPGVPYDLADKIIYLYENRDEMARYSALGHEFYKKHTWKKYKNRYIDLLNSLI